MDNPVENLWRLKLATVLCFVAFGCLTGATALVAHIVGWKRDETLAAADTAWKKAA